MTRRSNGEGSVRRRADGRWELQIGVGGDRKSLYGKTRKEVMEKRKALELSPRSRTSETLDDLARVWLANVVDPHLDKTTQRNYRTYLKNRILPLLGARKLSDLKPADIERWVADLRATTIKQGSIRTAMDILRNVLNYGVKTERMVRNPALAVPVPGAIPRTVPTPTPEELRRLIGALQADRYGPIFMAMLMLGLRRGEALGLTWDSIDFDNQIVHVRQQLKKLPVEGYYLSKVKSRAGVRDMHLPPQMATLFVGVWRLQSAEISSYQPLYRDKYDDWGLVFRTPEGRPVCPTNTLARLKLALKRAGLPPTLRLHDLRHHYASILFAQGVDPKIVQEQMGHSTLAVTMNIYTHLLPKAKRDASERAWSYLEGE